jgi:hypothetical protein
VFEEKWVAGERNCFFESVTLKNGLFEAAAWIYKGINKAAISK